MTIPRTSGSRVARRRAMFPLHFVEGRGWPEEPRAICGAPSSERDIAIGRIASASGDLYPLRFWVKSEVRLVCVECVRELEEAEK